MGVTSFLTRRSTQPCDMLRTTGRCGRKGASLPVVVLFTAPARPVDTAKKSKVRPFVGVWLCT